ncbi:MAG: branched-chain amino acid ABC transporter permease [Candidatus Caldarchaeum sp.]|nr:branched-chain amino acid ABC transporter permease [Candidatus Caldarchaeum sp.]MCS7129265.1 branched-chain amino acid ABC transporter permease [Candidatus Caldarchaeum sp.]MDW8360515.1 branched-chain amino acid ABC transporter permease [Candidatus Caldarchaeum sp.]
MSRIPNTYIALFAALAIFPAAVNNVLVHDVFILSALYAYLATAWNIQAGFAGLISIGHAAYFGIGAYTTGILGSKFGVPPLIGFLAGALISGAFAAATSAPVFRFGVKGYYYVLTTLAVAEALRLIFLAWDFVGRSEGVWVPPRGDSLWHLQFASSRIPYVYIILTMLILATLLSHYIRRAQFGLRLLSIREDEEAAQSVGVNTFRHKLIATVMSASLTSLGGAFYIQYTLFVEPDTSMSVPISIDILLPAMIGGQGTVIGPLVGSFVFNPLSWLTRIFFASDVLPYILRGILLILIVLLMPRGLVPVVEDYVKSRRARGG